MIRLARALYWRGDRERRDFEAAEALHLESYDALGGLYRQRASFVVILRRLIDLYRRLGDDERVRKFENELHGVIPFPGLDE